VIVCTKVHTITSLFIHSIFKCRINSLNSNCEYLISYIEAGFNTRWIDSSIIDEDDYYYDVLVKFNELLQMSQVLDGGSVIIYHVLF